MGGISRNSLCPCGSGKKYKHCCLGKEETAKPSKALFVAGGLGVISGVVCGLIFDFGAGARVGVTVALVAGLATILIKPPEKSRDRSSGSNIDFGR